MPRMAVSVIVGLRRRVGGVAAVVMVLAAAVAVAVWVAMAIAVVADD